MFDPTSPEIWLGYADESYVTTRLLWFTGLSIDASVNAHRTVELYLKAYLVGAGQEVSPGSRSWGHRLGELGEVCGRYSSEFLAEAVARRLIFFERYFDFVRYPNEPGSPEDGSLIWFGFNSNIGPLDELVAFIRPRISLPNSAWSNSKLNELSSSQFPERGYQKRALTDSNKHLNLILCNKTGSSRVPFDNSFRYDKLGC